VLDFPPELRERLLLEEGPFDEVLERWLGAALPRECGPEQIDWGLAYPWDRPPESYVLRGAEVEPPDDAEAWARDRHPVLAFGSNAAPSTLARKFAHFEDTRDREVLVVAGDLHDFDVGAAATVAIYGAMPATLFPSPGTAVRAAVLYLTDAQATQLTWSELSYRFGRLSARITSELDLRVDGVLAYVNRFGAFAPDGEPLALAAVAATDRTAPALSQRELLDRVAPLIGVATADDVVRAVHEDPADVFRRVRAHVRPRALPFASDRWTPFS
jgi:CBS domain-containing protein